MKRLLQLLFPLFMAAPASAQVDTLKSGKPLTVALDDSLSAVVGAIAATKAFVQYYERGEELTFRVYGKSGIGFLSFADKNADGVYAHDEMTYAEYGDAYAAIVVRDTGDSLAVTRADVARGKFKTESVYLAAKTAFAKSPAPLSKGAPAVAAWIVGRLRQK